MEYLFLIALGWFIQEFEPFRYLLTYIHDRSGRKPILEYIFGAIDCWQCCTFWSALAVTWSFEKAVIASFITFVIEMIHELWSRKR